MIETRARHFGTLHFIGIGGIGMSGIAEALHALGYTVQGSDQAESYNTKRLERHGIRVCIGHDANHLKTADGHFVSAVVVSSAIKNGNSELDAARALKLPIVRRADMLDPTVINGGIIHAYGTNTRMGSGEWMVVESDESDGSFNRLPTTIAVVTNIDPEHMDHYGSFDAVRAAYRHFVENIPFYGFAVICADHPETRHLIDTISDRRILSYGFDESADVRAVNINASTEGSTFDVVFSPRITGASAETVAGFTLPMMGQHNVQNVLVAIAIARAFDIPADQMRAALAGFQGVKRRFTKTGISNGITVIDDYGHHPVEIRATLSAARQAVAGTTDKVIAVMQPHRYSRLSALFPEFCAAFDDADQVIVADVYAAGEQPIDGFNRDTLVSGLLKHGHRGVHTLKSPDDLAALVARVAGPGDLVICLGAGSVTTWAHSLPEQLDALFNLAKVANG
jgi:UDP-N-acetylmuramate--alanine ligase